MPDNEIKIIVTAKDLSGPAIDSAEKRLVQLRAAAAAATEHKTLDVDAETGVADADLERTATAADRAAKNRTVKITADAGAATPKLDETTRKADQAARDRQVKVTADTALADAMLTAISGKGDRLSTDPKRMKIDADITQAEIKLAELKVKAESATGSAKIKLDADVASAEAQLAALKAARDGISNKSFTITADTGMAVARVGAIGSAIAALIPLAIAAAGAIAGIGAVGAVGLGAAMAGFAGVGGAMKAMDTAATGAGGSAKSMASQVQAANAQIVSSQRQVQAAHEGVTAAAHDLATAQDAVGAAERGVTAAHEGVAAAGRALEAADRGVESAQRTLAAANRGVEASERALASADLDAQRAQQALTDARQAAARTLEDLQTQTEDMALSERRASLTAQQAKEDLDKTLADPRASQLQKEQARLTYDESIQHSKDLQQQATRLAQDKADADAKGVDGSKQVTAAQDAVTAANQRVIDATQGIADATQRVADAQQGVIDARQKVADANLNVANANQKVIDAEKGVSEAHYRVAEAQQKVVDANLRLTDAQHALAEAQAKVGQSGQSAGGGVNALALAMAKLTPAGREFVLFMHSFVNGPLKSLQDAGQQAFLPGIEAGLKAIIPMMKALEPSFAAFSGTLGKAIGGMIPIIMSLAKPLMDFADASLKGLAPLKDVLIQFTAQFGAMLEQLVKSGTAQAAMKALVDVVAALLPILPALIEAGAKLLVSLGPGLAKAVTVVADALVFLLDFLANNGPVVEAIALTFLGLSGVLAIITSPISLVVAGIAALVGGITWLLTQTKTGQQVLSAFGGAVSTIAKAVSGFFAGGGGDNGKAISGAFSSIGSSLSKLAPMFTQIKNWMVSTFQELLPQMKDLWGKIYSTIATYIQFIAAVISAAVKVITVIWNAFGPTILANIKIVMTTLIGVISGALDIIKGVLNVFTGLLTGNWSKAWDGVKQIVTGALGIIKSVISGGFNLVKNDVSLAMTAVSNVISSAWDKTVTYFKGIGSRLAAAGSGMWNWLTSGFKSAINTVVRGWNSLSFSIPAVTFAGISTPSWTTGPGLGHPMAQLAAGGIVKARPGGTVVNVGEGAEDEVISPLSKLSGLGGSQLVQLEIHSGGSALDDLLVELLRRAIRTRGGNVQVALGQAGR